MSQQLGEALDVAEAIAVHVCPVCAGTGTVGKLEHVTCPSCHGNGWRGGIDPLKPADEDPLKHILEHAQELKELLLGWQQYVGDNTCPDCGPWTLTLPREAQDLIQKILWVVNCYPTTADKPEHKQCN